MGDSIGVLFFVPLTLLAFPEARPRRLGLAARLAIPLIVVGVLVAVAHRATQDSRREHTSREMAAIENELQFQLNSQITNLHLVERLLTLAPDIVRRQFLSKLEGFGVTRIESEGRPFDPSVHEAIAAVPATVLEEVTKG